MLKKVTLTLFFIEINTYEYSYTIVRNILDVVAETFITFNFGQGIKLIRILSLS